VSSTEIDQKIITKKRIKGRKFPYHIIVFILPALLIYSVIMVYPLIDTMGLSFMQGEAGQERTYAGLANYLKLLSDDLLSPQFFNALQNNVYFFCIHMVVQNLIGLALAATISLTWLKGKAVYRTVFFLPTILSFVIIGFTWKLILSPLWGISESFLDFFGLVDYFQPWLGLEETALTTVSLISVWQFVGIPMMLIYAAFLNIPEELFEAARVDGAGGWTVFWRIRLPLILPTLGIISILTFVGNFNAFDLIYTTQGALAGPNFSTELLGTFFYRTFFGFQLQLGDPYMGATIATVMFLIILFVLMIYFYTIHRKLNRYEF
jgi:raffinose/stachyose/melibiose transport system permease protein